jgi:hypothetical protein
MDVPALLGMRPPEILQHFTHNGLTNIKIVELFGKEAGKKLANKAQKAASYLKPILEGTDTNPGTIIVKSDTGEVLIPVSSFLSQ